MICLSRPSRSPPRRLGISAHPFTLAGVVAIRGKLPGVLVLVIGGLALVLASIGAAAGEEPKFSGGDGSSCEDAVVPVVREGATMVETERQWLQKTYGGGELVRQLLGASADGKRRYDVILWRKPDGQTVDVCFDVTTVFEDTIREIEAEEEHGDPHNSPR